MQKQSAMPTKRGRPLVPAGTKLARQVKINLNEAQVKLVHEAAKAADMPVAKWLRDVVLKELDQQ